MRPLVLFLALFVAAGCGAKQGGDIRGAANAMAKAGTSRIAVSYDGKQTVTADFDYDDQVGVVEFRGEVQQIVTRDAVYTRLAAFDLQTEKLGNKRWVRNDEVSKSRGLFQPVAANPGQLLSFLSAVSDIEKTGKGEERGFPVTRYRATLRVERALEELPERERIIAGETIRQYWTDGAKEGIPLDLAVDADGRLRRVALTIPDDTPLVLEFYDYGIEVKPTPPPVSEVVTWAEMVDLLASEEQPND